MLSRDFLAGAAVGVCFFFLLARGALVVFRSTMSGAGDAVGIRVIFGAYIASAALRPLRE